MGCSLPGSSVHGIFQAIVLEWIAISFSRGSSRPRDGMTLKSTSGLFQWLFNLMDFPIIPLIYLFQLSFPLLASQSILTGWYMWISRKLGKENYMVITSMDKLNMKIDPCGNLVYRQGYSFKIWVERVNNSIKTMWDSFPFRKLLLDFYSLLVKMHWKIP